MTGKKKLPIGIDIFEKMDREEFYYVDNWDDRRSDTEQE